MQPNTYWLAGEIVLVTGYIKIHATKYILIGRKNTMSYWICKNTLNKILILAGEILLVTQYIKIQAAKYILVGRRNMISYRIYKNTCNQIHIGWQEK